MNIDLHEHPDAEEVVADRVTTKVTPRWTLPDFVVTREREPERRANWGAMVTRLRNAHPAR